MMLLVQFLFPPMYVGAFHVLRHAIRWSADSCPICSARVYERGLTGYK